VNVEAVIGLKEFCGEMSGNSSGLPLLSKKLRTASAGVEPVLIRVIVVVQEPAEAS
jgi:hypothetical protein